MYANIKSGNLHSTTSSIMTGFLKHFMSWVLGVWHHSGALWPFVTNFTAQLGVYSNPGPKGEFMDKEKVFYYPRTVIIPTTLQPSTWPISPSEHMHTTLHSRWILTLSENWTGRFNALVNLNLIISCRQALAQNYNMGCFSGLYLLKKNRT